MPKEKQAEATANAAQWLAKHYEGDKKDSHRLPAIYAALSRTVSETPHTNVAPVMADAAPIATGPSTRIASIQEQGVVHEAPQRQSAIA